MNPEAPIISIIMATYNRSHLITETLDSILKQTFNKWECIIIDDGSTDSTKEILQPYLQNDSRLKYTGRKSEHKKGLPGCRNQGLGIAKGKYIIFFDDDDIVHPDCLNLSFFEIEKRNVDYCRFLRSVFQENNIPNFDLEKKYSTTILENNIYEKMISGAIPFNSCQILWKKSCFKNDQFNEELMFAEEWELYSRILSQKIQGINLSKVLYFGRKHPNSNTGEFYRNNPVRRASKVKALHLVIYNLSKRALLSPNLVQYFIRTGFHLKEISIIKIVLEHSNADVFEKIKYILGFRIYPILKPFFNFKAKLKKY